MKRETDRFTAVGDDGQRYIVIEFRKVLTMTTLTSGKREKLGAYEYFLLDGRDVIWEDDTKFKIIQTDEIIRKI